MIIAASAMFMACQEKKSPTPSNANDSNVYTQLQNNQAFRETTFDELSNQDIEIARAMFLGYSSYMKAEFWKYKLEKWKAECEPSDVELRAIDALLPKLNESCFDDDRGNVEIVSYIENEWLQSIQPYIEFDRLVILAASPYYPVSNKPIVGGTGGTEGADCDCSSGRSSDWCAGFPGTGGPASKSCQKLKLCSLSGCGWFWFQRCDGVCK